MQEVLIDDVLAAAAVVAHVPSHLQEWVLRRLFCEATAADLYRKDRGRAHWIWGDGTLATAAGRRPRYSPARLSDPCFRQSVLRVIQSLGEIYPLAQDTHMGCVGSASKRPDEISSPHSVQ